MTAPQPKPIFLLADSQLLFWKRDGKLVLDAALVELPRDTPPSAAYIGASNGDHPEFYEIFEAAMDAVGITDRRMIHSSFGPDDRAFLQGARLIVLAGGDVGLGWKTFEKSGMKDVILDRYTKGAILVGISAGAIQLGRCGIVETLRAEQVELLDMFDLVPLVIDTHDERADWARLSRTIQLLEGTATGLGIPAGGGVIAQADGTIEPLRLPAYEFRLQGSVVARSVLPADVRPRPETP
ncbi:Type 1 glutamine amidotransferase-like domain-containing protein [Mycobacterium sp. M23085]|uniref:Type 1 glutamine amidotransferase-like domain-containing protein n=1 Tax=Mycobacterium sp. M23085 TaxID=3378087 RepID=UPI0038779DBC